MKGRKSKAHLKTLQQMSHTVLRIGNFKSNFWHNFNKGTPSKYHLHLNKQVRINSNENMHKDNNLIDLNLPLMWFFIISFSKNDSFHRELQMRIQGSRKHLKGKVLQ